MRLKGGGNPGRRRVFIFVLCILYVWYCEVKMRLKGGGESWEEKSFFLCSLYFVCLVL